MAKPDVHMQITRLDIHFNICNLFNTDKNYYYIHCFTKSLFCDLGAGGLTKTYKMY